MLKVFSLICLLCALACCTRVPDRVEPALHYAVPDRYLRSLPSPFAPLTEQELAQDWGKEMRIGHFFAHQLDLYQAITAFKRAEVLIPPSEKDRLLEIQYEILLCYYIGLKWEDTIHTFENSGLKNAQLSFPALHDMLIVLYDTYLRLEDDRGAQRILFLLHQYFPEEAPNLQLSTALAHADFPTLHLLAESPPPKPYLEEFLTTYSAQKKSIGTAQALNAVLPGAGYFYLGQKQSGVTAFLLNGLFIAASAYFFDQGNIAAGIIFTSFEAGWYFGGIYGAGLEAKFYNERLYERLATPMMTQERLFPVLMLKYAF